MDFNGAPFDSLAMITGDLAVENAKSAKRSKGRSRSRPRAIDGTNNSDDYRSGAKVTVPSISIPAKDADKRSKVFQPSSSDVRGAFASSTVSPRRSRYNPPKKIDMHTAELDMKINFQSPDGNVPKKSTRKLDVTQDFSFPLDKGSIKLTTSPGINKTLSEESDESVFITPTKKKLRIDNEDANAIPPSVDPIHYQEIPSFSKQCKTVTPSPSEQSDSLSNAVRPRPNGKNVDLDGGSKISANRNVKQKRLKRVSKLRRNGTKKPPVALAKAITVGKKTIPARQVVKLRKMKPPSVKKVQIPCETDRTSKYLSKKKSTNSKKSTMKTMDSDHTDRLIKRLETTRKQWPITKGKKRLEASKIAKMKASGHTDMTELKKNGKRKMPISLNKESMLKFISEMMNDLETLKETVTKSDDRNIIDLADLKRDFIPLSKMDILLDCRKKRERRHWSGGLSAASSKKRRALASTRNTPSLPSFSMRTPAGKMFSPFFTPDFGDDESVCESVIDLGTISNSQALVSYTRNGSLDKYKNKIEDSDRKVGQSTRLDRKHQAKKSRIQNSCTDILATLGCATTHEEKKRSDSKATLLSLPSNCEDSGTIAKQIMETPPMETQLPSSKNNPMGPIINDPFEKLLAMDHDELIEEVLKERAEQSMSNESALVEVSYRETDDNSSSSEDSMQDDLLQAISNLAY